MVMMIIALSLLGLGAALFYTFRVSNIPLTQGIDSSEEADKLTRIHGAIAKGAMAFLKENARAAAAQHGGDADAIAFHAWSCAHGLAMLMLDRQIPGDDAIIDRVIGGWS